MKQLKTTFIYNDETSKVQYFNINLFSMLLIDLNISISTEIMIHDKLNIVKILVKNYFVTMVHNYAKIS